MVQKLMMKKETKFGPKKRNLKVKFGEDRHKKKTKKKQEIRRRKRAGQARGWRPPAVVRTTPLGETDRSVRVAAGAGHGRAVRGQRVLGQQLFFFQSHTKRLAPVVVFQNNSVPSKSELRLGSWCPKKGRSSLT